jgi:hypothetical protein
MQTETPYFQPSPDANSPFTIGKFPSDPTFEDCESGSSCAEAWALRVLNSSDIFVYSAGFYSFFSSYDQDCVPMENCQLRLLETSCTQGLWVYNIFTKGVVQMASPQGYVRSSEPRMHHSLTFTAGSCQFYRTTVTSPAIPVRLQSGFLLQRLEETSELAVMVVMVANWSL